ncbi:MAG: hypothetical protein EOO47_13215 [Flavobacterium sp.]|nr:MAG: hypothetical protein EOO47_13215 [Flavobacterium sp.]
MNNPLLEPIHGVTLFDYAAICGKTAAGIPEADLLKAIGIEKSVYEEASALWIARMQEDSTWEVTTKFGEYFASVDTHPKLGNLQGDVSEEGKNNLEKLKNDRYFYEELNGARQAAYEYGIDGAQWVQDNFGINLGDFQSVAMQWMPITSNEEYETMKVYLDYRQQKQDEYAAKFAADQGGNVADDIDF